MKTYLLLLSRTFLLLFILYAMPSCVKYLMADSIEDMISHSINQVKTVVLRKLSSGEIEDIINLVREKGATGYKINHYSGGKTGWSMLDSRGREVYSVAFSFHGRQAIEGTYFGPLMSSFNDAQNIHALHMQVLSKSFKRLEWDKYDVGNKCIALAELFKDSSDAGQTKITVKCYQHSK